MDLGASQVRSHTPPTSPIVKSVFRTRLAKEFVNVSGVDDVVNVKTIRHPPGTQEELDQTENADSTNAGNGSAPRFAPRPVDWTLVDTSVGQLIRSHMHPTGTRAGIVNECPGVHDR
jgi:hypothetical protein